MQRRQYSRELTGRGLPTSRVRRQRARALPPTVGHGERCQCLHLCSSVPSLRGRVSLVLVSVQESANAIVMAVVEASEIDWRVEMG